MLPPLLPPLLPSLLYLFGLGVVAALVYFALQPRLPRFRRSSLGPVTPSGGNKALSTSNSDSIHNFKPTPVTNRTKEEIACYGDFPNYASLSNVPLPKPYEGFDIKMALPRPYRPFRWAYHQTMC
jgi:hypothetical protein